MQDFWRGVFENIWGNGRNAQQPQQPQQPQPEQPRRRAPRPAAMQVPAGDSGAGSMAAQHFSSLGDMVGNVNREIGAEMDSRRRQAREERGRQHEYQMEMLRQQRAAAQAQPMPQPVQMEDDDALRQQRNRDLLGMAGLGGHTVRSDGRGGVKVSHHPFTSSPFGRSLFG